MMESARPCHADGKGPSPDGIPRFCSGKTTGNGGEPNFSGYGLLPDLPQQ
jgi:hypothetical protein